MLNKRQCSNLTAENVKDMSPVLDKLPFEYWMCQFPFYTQVIDSRFLNKSVAKTLRLYKWEIMNFEMTFLVKTISHFFIFSVQSLFKLN